MKQITVGTPFEVPLPDQSFGYGYISFWGYDNGVLCVLMNIFDLRSDEPLPSGMKINEPVLIRDLVSGSIHFRRTKSSLAKNVFWPLRRDLGITDKLDPKYGYIFSNGVQALDGTSQARLVSEQEQYQYPHHALQNAQFYPLYILGQLTDRHVVLIDKVKDADGKTVSPARFELRRPDEMNDLKPYGFAGAADTLIPHQ